MSGVHIRHGRLHGATCWGWTDETRERKCPLYDIPQDDIDAEFDDRHRTAVWTCDGCGTAYAEPYDEPRERPAHHDVEPEAKGSLAIAQAPFILVIIGCALLAVGALGRSLPLVLGGVWLAISPIIIAAWLSGRPRKDNS
jgi:ribosomal protein L37AE/L43A